jgi:2-C-methyl-D-erythritol 2,4-cyclodiphosphate synthase
MKIGLGFDSHRFVEGKPFILGGIQIPHSMGLKGHSDGDALIHAIIDALFGAAGLPDIGELFPPSDEQFKDIDSKILLSKIIPKIHQKGFSIVNIDCVVICEKPKLSPHKKQMIDCLAQLMGIAEDQINIKSKTAESMGAFGREEGIAVIVNALLEKQKHS